MLHVNDGRTAATWRVEPSSSQTNGSTPRISIAIEGRAPLALALSCWRLSIEGSPERHCDFVWRHAARQCFPSCSDKTRPITSRELEGDRGTLARRVARAAWSWGQNREGLRFTMAQGEGLLITPWGHGTWGLVPSRPDVLVAEFAQQRHMLRFFESAPKYVSTRCNDGDLLAGSALRSSEQAGGALPAGWWLAH